MKEFFKILLAVQVFSVAWAAFYGNPDAEIIDTQDSSSGSSLKQFIIDAAIRRGMDGEAVAELLRTRQPVVRVKIEPPGTKKTTTYTLESDGSIASKTRIEMYSSSVPESVYIPKSHSGTVTRTFTSNNGPKVGRGGMRPNFDDNSDDNWFGSISPTVHQTSGFPPNVFGNPSSPWPSEARTGPRKHTKIYTNANGDRRIVQTIVDDDIPTNYRPTTKTFKGPNGETRVVKTFSSNPFEGSELPSSHDDFPTISHDTGNDEFPTNYRQTTKTFKGPNGETRVVKTFSSNPFEASGFPSSHEDPPTISHDTGDDEFPTNYRHTTKTFRGPNGETRVVKTFSSNPFDVNEEPSTFYEPKFTTKEQNIPSPSWPSFNEPYFPTSWLPHETMGDPDDWTVVEDDSTESTTASQSTSTSTTVTTVKPKQIPTESTSTQKPKPAEPAIKVTTPLPSLDEFLRRQYGPATPSTKKETTTNSKNPIPTAPTTTPKPARTSTQKQITPTTTTTKKPMTINIEDLPVAEVLQNGKPADDVIIKKLPPHMQPKLNTGNVMKIENKYPIEVEHTKMEEHIPKATNTNLKVPPRTFYDEPKPVIFSPPLSPISAFLARFDLTKSALFASGGEYTRTIVDDDGSVLEVRFILSSPMHGRHVNMNIPYK
ncbi:uncharacterized protein [Musca autumnalis]|uniref:uncharacterized protein n=1 Tax=Musca autumnalis TaxID=221902 RepID=UPI003CE9917E